MRFLVARLIGNADGTVSIRQPPFSPFLLPIILSQNGGVRTDPPRREESYGGSIRYVLRSKVLRSEKPENNFLRAPPFQTKPRKNLSWKGENHEGIHYRSNGLRGLQREGSADGEHRNALTLLFPQSPPENCSLSGEVYLFPVLEAADGDASVRVGVYADTRLPSGGYARRAGVVVVNCREVVACDSGHFFSGDHSHE